MYAVTRTGPWVKLDDVVAVEPVIGEERFDVTLANGQVLEVWVAFGAKMDTALALVEAVRQHDRGEDEPAKRRRTL